MSKVLSNYSDTQLKAINRQAELAKSIKTPALNISSAFSKINSIHAVNNNYQISIAKTLIEANKLSRLNMSNTLALNPMFNQPNYFKEVSTNIQPISSILKNTSIQTAIGITTKNYSRYQEINKKLLYISSLFQKLELYYPEVDIDEMSLEEIEKLVYNYEYTTEFLALDKLQLTMFNAINTFNDIPNSISDGLNKVNTIVENKIGKKSKYIISGVALELINYQIENNVNEYFHNSTAFLFLNIFFLINYGLFKFSLSNNKDTDD